MIGKKEGTIINLGIDHAIAISAVLSEILSKEIHLDVISEDESRIWANTLRVNIHKLRVIKPDDGRDGYAPGFLVVQGTDVKRMFTKGYYKGYIIHFEPSWDLAKELDSEWLRLINRFISFLEKSGGIAEVVW